MRRRIAPLIALFALFVASCSDTSRRDLDPTSPSVPGSRLNSTTAPCVTNTQLVGMINDVFGAGSPNANSALGKLDNLEKQLQKGNIADAQTQALNIVAFVQQKASQGLPGTHEQIQTLISSVLCYVGLSPNTFLIYPTDLAQVILHSSGTAGISFLANTVGVPTLVTIELLPTNIPPLNTKLDQYPGFIHITQSSPLTKPAIVGVCPAATVPAIVVPRLRLGHQTSTGFQIAPDADASFLNCTTSTASTESRMPGWVQRLASFFTPKPLYATTTTLFGGGVGGLVTEFSPFGPVDEELSFRGGAGGTVTEFNVRPDTTATARLPRTPVGPSLNRTPGSRVNTVVNGVCTQIDALPGGAVENECRPFVTIQTYQGTLLQNVPISWAIGLGGGVVAPEATPAHTCGTFGASASTTTNANGFSSVCWTLGSTAGANTLIATPGIGGDVPAGVTYSRQSITFNAVALQITPTATATGGTFPYDGLPHAGSGTCSNGLTPALTYTGGSAPTNVGTYTLTVTCGAGNPLYVTVTQTATIEITPAATTTTVSCPTSVSYTGSPQTPCTANVTGPGLSQSLTPSYSSNTNAGTATATATYAGGGNYAGSTGSKTFLIGPAATVATVTCPVSVSYTGSPITPCTGTVTGPGLSLNVTPTYTSNTVGTATATVNYAGGGNYAPSSASTTFQILYVQLGCFASPIYSVMPSTKSFQNKGSNVPVKCALLTASGAGVSGATGDLLVQDLGIEGNATPTTVFSLANAFTASASGNYSYGLDTSPAGFISKHFYLVTATWSDGSKTTGYFYIK